MTLNVVVDAPEVEVTGSDLAPGAVRPALVRATELAHWTMPGMAAAAAGVVVGASPGVSGAVALVWLATYALRHRTRQRALSLDTAVRLVVVPLAVVALAAAVGLAGPVDLRAAALGSLLATLVAHALTLLEGRLSGPARVLVVGDDSGVVRVLNRWASSREVEVVGVRTVHTAFEPWLARAVADEARETRAQAVVLLPNARIGGAGVQALCWALEGTGTSLQVLTDLDRVGRHRVSLTSIEGVTTAEVASSRAPRAVRAAKAGLDRALAAVLLVLLSPVMLAMVLLVRLDSPGGALFRQVRIGRDGVPFTLYKLRTMTTDAEDTKASLAALDEGNGVLFKMRRDPRVTRVGSLLRRTSLDELPQLINVVRGEMSLVGPRPALPDEVAAYDDRVRRRLVVRPGMTGLWQVSGRSDLDWEESVALDLAYTDNVSVVGDLHICLRTVRAVTSGRGAY